MSAAVVVGGLALLVLLTGWFGYPLLLRAHPRRPARPAAPGEGREHVSVVIATREAPSIVAARVQDVRAGEYPAALLEVVVAVDRDAPFATAEYAERLGDAARVVRAEAAAGKAAALNRGVASAAHPLVVFTDSAQRFAPDAIARLVEYLADPRFGAVSGQLRLPHDEGGGSVLGSFWRYELLLRRLEARTHSLVAVTGAVYAVRRELWRPLPAGLICDDLFVPLEVARRGARVGFCPAATATDPRRFTREQEFERKVRTLTGMVQMCAWEPWILVPWRNPLWLQFACHKLVRLATPFLVLVIGLAAAWELGRAGWLLPLAAAGLGLGALALGVLWLARPALARSLLARAGMALRLLGSPLWAVRNGLRGDWNVWGVREPRPRG